MWTIGTFFNFFLGLKSEFLFLSCCYCFFFPSLMFMMIVMKSCSGCKADQSGGIQRGFTPSTHPSLKMETIPFSSSSSSLSPSLSPPSLPRAAVLSRSEPLIQTDVTQRSGTELAGCGGQT